MRDLDVIANYCDDIGTLEFERYWAKRGCQVGCTLYDVH